LIIQARPTVLVTLKKEVGKIIVLGQPGQKVSKTSISARKLGVVIHA
jgi:hypothetical protein